MHLGSFSEAMDNKLTANEKSKIQAYFRAFDAQQKSYLTYSDYLLGLLFDVCLLMEGFLLFNLGLAAMDPNTSHGGMNSFFIYLI
jgi:hypothetical protein